MSVRRPAAPAAAGFAADWLGQRVVFADGALDQLPAEAAALGAERVLLIAGRSRRCRRPGCGTAGRTSGQPLGGHPAARSW